MSKPKVVAAGAVVGVSVLVSSAVAVADIVGTGQWGSSPGTWQLQNPTSSNQAGFWQTLLCSNTHGFDPVDGYFGPLTRSGTIKWQKEVLGYSTAAADGVVDAATWNDTFWAVTPAPDHPRRLDIDASGYHTYYGGGNAVALYQNRTSSGIWKFYHGSNNEYHGATNADTIPASNCTHGGT